MIYIHFSDQKDILSLTCIGHAAYAPKGQDIVCSAVSILVYTLARNVKEKADLFDGPPTVEIREGCAKIEGRPKEENREAATMLFSFAVKGFEMLEKGYPHYIKGTSGYELYKLSQ